MLTTRAMAVSSTDTQELASPIREQMEWWYANILIDAPGTPIDGYLLLGAFMRFDGVTEEGRYWLVSPETGMVADFGTGRQAPGSAMRASEEKVDVSNGPSYFRGGYPSYELHIEGEADGTPHSATLTYEADVAPEQSKYIDGQLKHFAVYRMKVAGSISIGEDTYEVTGLGYYEHLYGTMAWFPSDDDTARLIEGWSWYWSPDAGPDDVTVEIGGFIVEGEREPFLSLCADGQNPVMFASGDMETLEEREHSDGVDYPHQLRFTDSNERGSVDLVVTRRDAAFRGDNRFGDRALFFMTGFATFEGTATLDGVEHDLTGRAFGSVFRVVDVAD